MRSPTLFALGIFALTITTLSQNPAAKPSFEVASIKPSTAARPRIGGMPNGRFVANAISLQGLAAHAYRGQRVEFRNSASWMDSELWDIEAKAPEGAKVTLNPFDLTTPDTMALMVQSLLEDRFQLKMHNETKELPVYELTIAKGGPKIKLSEDQTPLTLPEPGAPRGGVIPRGAMRMGVAGLIEGSALPFPAFVATLSQPLGRPVIDKTGLNGLYDVKLQWTPDAVSGTPNGPFGPGIPGTAVAPSDLSGPSIFAAIQEQLGLKLDSAKGSIEVLVIDGAQKPRLN